MKAQRIFETNDWDLGRGVVMRNVHDDRDCKKPCPFHGPSDHHMVEWDQGYVVVGHDNRNPCMVRYCEHEIPHPDPDSFLRDELLWHSDCDGCCHPEQNQQKLV